jgi:hypothetical protein
MKPDDEKKQGKQYQDDFSCLGECDASGMSKVW